MDKKKKFSLANMLYVFSVALGLTIVVVGFSVANSAKKEIENQTKNISEPVKQMKEIKDAETVSKTAEKVEKKVNEEKEEVVVINVKKSEPEKDEFAPMLEDYVMTKPANGEIMTSFTGKSLVYSPYYDEWSVRKGIDIAAKESAQVKAAANGRVKSVYKDNRQGIVIVLEHGDFNTVYGNLSTTELVKVGDEVYAGDIISGVGKSAEGKTFLHFEISYKGEDIDPEPLIN